VIVAFEETVSRDGQKYRGNLRYATRQGVPEYCNVKLTEAMTRMFWAQGEKPSQMNTGART
jgi:hypothetical protein